jgi:hypothetical protein
MLLHVNETLILFLGLSDSVMGIGTFLSGFIYDNLVKLGVVVSQ